MLLKAENCRVFCMIDYINRAPEVRAWMNQITALGEEHLFQMCRSVPDVQKGLGLGRIRRI